MFRIQMYDSHIVYAYDGSKVSMILSSSYLCLPITSFDLFHRVAYIIKAWNGNQFIMN
jgi:hypothetical protein